MNTHIIIDDGECMFYIVEGSKGAISCGYKQIENPLPDVFYHSYKSRYKGQPKEYCSFLRKKCYCEVAPQFTMDIFKFQKLINKKNKKALWDKLEEYYKEIFGDDNE